MMPYEAQMAGMSQGNTTSQDMPAITFPLTRQEVVNRFGGKAMTVQPRNKELRRGIDTLLLITRATV